LRNWGCPLEYDENGKAAIASFLLDCFNGLNVYGSTADQIKSAIKIHIITLGEYPLVLVKKAYLKWLKISNKHPTPADIISIMEEENKQLLGYINHVREHAHYANLGLAPEAHEFLEDKLGKDWRKYV
jgi:hypothetical protein